VQDKQQQSRIQYDEKKLGGVRENGAVEAKQLAQASSIQ